MLRNLAEIDRALMEILLLISFNYMFSQLLRLSIEMF